MTFSFDSKKYQELFKLQDLLLDPSFSIVCLVVFEKDMMSAGINKKYSNENILGIMLGVKFCWISPEAFASSFHCHFKCQGYGSRWAGLFY